MTIAATHQRREPHKNHAIEDAEKPGWNYSKTEV